MIDSTLAATDTEQKSADAGQHISQVGRPRLHLDFLDGIRGIAALYVAQYHIAGAREDLPSRAEQMTRWLTHGHYAVGIFIVLSGYCLMLPVTRSMDGTLRGGFGNYIKRRARRILPPYYAALAFTLLLIAATQLVKHASGSANSGAGAFNGTDLLLHVTLLHNLSPHWRQAIDPPMWSVGLEWQIYFLFPLFLLPLWRRSGTIVTVCTAVLLTSLPHLLLPIGVNLDYVYLWFVGLFAMGMAGAAINFSEKFRDRYLRDRVPWGVLSAVFGLTALVLSGRSLVDEWTMDLLIGLSTAGLLVYCALYAAHQQSGARPAIVRLLSARYAVILGNFSYSLYLIHLPAWWLIQPVMRALHLHGAKAFAFQLIIGVPFAVGAAYLFHLAFEKRFMSK